LHILYHKTFTGYDFTTKRLAFVIIGMGMGYIIIKFVVESIVHKYFPIQTQLYHEREVSAQVITIIMIMLIFFIYEGIYYLNKSRNTEIEKNKLEKVSAEQKLSTLKNQVNPHFLFNSLNTLVTMIPEEPKLAIEFVQKLSTTYRNILELRDEKLIPLRQELKSLDSYIYLLKTRFQGKIQIYNHLDAHLSDKFILPLSLQILIENAVKHNITSKKKPLRIGISEEDGYIVVKNNLQKKDQQYNSTKMGLANIQSRYRLLINAEIIIEESEDSFTVKLPIIENTKA